MHSKEEPDAPRPPEREGYHGVSERTAILSRGAAFGVPAFFFGRWIARLFEKEHGVNTGNSPYATGIAFGLFAGIMGAYAASRSARAAKRQFDHMQENVQSLDAENQALKTELQQKTQPDADRETEPRTEEEKEKPSESISAESASEEPLTQTLRERA